jgi:hypothetical protein
MHRALPGDAPCRRLLHETRRRAARRVQEMPQSKTERIQCQAIVVPHQSEMHRVKESYRCRERSVSSETGKHLCWVHNLALQNKQRRVPVFTTRKDHPNRVRWKPVGDVSAGTSTENSGSIETASLSRFRSAAHGQLASSKSRRGDR